MKKLTAKVVHNGNTPIIEINGKPYTSLAFKSFRPTERNISDFYNAGLRIFNILATGTKSMIGLDYSLFGEPWVDDEKYNFSAIDNQIDFFIKYAPDAYFGIMLVLDTREWWHKKRENYPDSYNNFGKMMMEPEWNKYATLYLERAVKHIEEKYGDKVFGYFLLNARTTEWFSMNYEKPSQFVFDDVKNKKLNFKVPTDDIIETDMSRILLNKESDYNLIEYRKYLSNTKSDIILNFAKIVKEITNRQKLVGVYFGYCLEMDITGFINHGNIEFDRIFHSKDIDIISSPISYKHRSLDEPTTPMCTYTTLKENNKIYYLEFDHVTHCAKLCPVPGFSDRAGTPEDSLDFVEREYAYFITQGSSYWWFDMFEGWFYDEKLMEAIRKQIEISNKLIDYKMSSNSEVAFIVDTKSYYYMNKNNELYSGSIVYQLKDLELTGVSFDCYTSSDLEKCLHDQYKVIFFSNQIVVSTENEELIKKLKEKGKTLCFIYSPGYIKNGNFSFENMKKILGMEMAKQPFESTICLENGEVIEVTKSANYPYEDFKASGDELFYIDDDEVIPLGYYKNSKHVAVGYKKEGKSIIVYCGFGPLPESLFRKLYEISGVHMFTKDNELVVNTNSDLISVYHRNKKDSKIYLLDNATYVDLYTNKQYKSKNKEIDVTFNNERTKLFLKIKQGD